MKTQIMPCCWSAQNHPVASQLKVKTSLYDDMQDPRLSDLWPHLLLLAASLTCSSHTCVSLFLEYSKHALFAWDTPCRSPTQISSFTPHSPHPLVGASVPLLSPLCKVMLSVPLLHCASYPWLCNRLLPKCSGLKNINKHFISHHLWESGILEGLSWEVPASGSLRWWLEWEQSRIHRHISVSLQRV